MKNMKNMKRNVLLIPVIAAMMLFVVGLASAGPLAHNLEVEFNGEDILNSNQLSSFAGEVVPVRVTFIAGEDSKDVRITASIYDGRDDFSATSSRFNTIAGSKYTKLMSLRIPSNFDGSYRELTLNIEIDDSNHLTTDLDEDFKLQVQRESYTLDVLSIDYTSTVSAGDVFPVAVVIENNGFNNVEDNYVVVSIPELGVSTQGYVGDLDSYEDYRNDNHEEDAVEEIVYIRIPEDAAKGVYNMEVTVYNDDSSVTTSTLLSVEGSASTVLAADKSKDLNAGETVTYEIVIVNSADSVKIFELSSISGDSLHVSVPSVVTVGPDASEVISVSVTADSAAQVGTYTFTVDVDDSQVVFGANIVGSSEEVSSSTVALTVVLVIIFVVLLAVLVVLLTRKEKPMEEVETSYY